jgi:signal transduction histidine kinase
MRFSSIVRGRLPSPFEFQYRHKNGSTRWAEAHVAFQELDGKRVGIHGMIRDITERKQNEETLIALHRHARELARCPSLEEVYDQSVRVMTETLKFPRVDILMVEGDVLIQVTGSGGIPLGVQIPLGGKGVTVKAIKEKRSLLVNDVSQSEDYIYSPNGAENEPFGGYPLSQSELVAPIIVGGEAIGVLNVEDIRLNAFTEQNKMFLELLAMHVASAVYRLRRFEELVTLVEEKTGELVDAERMMTAGRISSMVGHDLRGPLQTIKNSLYMMERHPERQEEMLKLIDSSVDYSVEMLEELRARTQKDKLRRQDTDLRNLLRRAAAEASVPGNVDLDLSLGDGVGSIVVDPTQIRRVIDNLLRNAVEAMPDGGKLTVSSEVQGDDIDLRVRDTGVGISEDELGNLFKPFHTTKSKGMGLGLVYCKRAVEAHGGSIVVESKVGVGTTFIVRLPMNW